MSRNSQFMQLAIKEAWKYQLLTYPNPAVGATVTKNNKILSVESHKETGLPHAEVNALKAAYLTEYQNTELLKLITSHEIHNFLIKNHNNFFHDCEIYVTLEPCNHLGKTPACSKLLELVGIKKVYIGTLDTNKEASGGLKKLRDANIKVEINICKEQTDDLLYPFIKWQKNNFVFFKLAMRENGRVTGGYITTKDSLKLVHDIRTKLNLMVIGGETVRTDKPILDARFSFKNKAPNILIYSNKKEFDKTIPLFNVENRDVVINNNLKLLDDNNFIMFEGGYNLLETIKDKVDMLMLFISHEENNEDKFDIESLGFRKVYSYMLNEFDEVVFLFKLS